MKYTVDLDKKTVEVICNPGEEVSQQLIDKVMNRLALAGFTISIITRTASPEEYWHISHTSAHPGNITFTDSTNGATWDYDLSTMQNNITTINAEAYDTKIHLDKASTRISYLETEVRRQIERNNETV